MCVINGGTMGCQKPRKLSRASANWLLTLAEENERIAFIPDEREFTIAKVRKALSRKPYIMISIRDDGAVEICNFKRAYGLKSCNCP